MLLGNDFACSDTIGKARVRFIIHIQQRTPVNRGGLELATLIPLRLRHEKRRRMIYLYHH